MFGFAFIRLFLVFPHWDALIKLGNRTLDYLEGAQQAEIDALTSRIKNLSAAIKTAVTDGEK